MNNHRSPEQQDALLLVADWHWRRGPRWRAAVAWLLGRREVIRTHLGDVAVLSWWRSDPFLVDLKDGGR